MSDSPSPCPVRARPSGRRRAFPSIPPSPRDLTQESSGRRRRGVTLPLSPRGSIRARFHGPVFQSAQQLQSGLMVVVLNGLKLTLQIVLDRLFAALPVVRRQAV